MDPIKEQKRQKFLREKENTDGTRKESQKQDSKKTKDRTKDKTSKTQQTQEVAMAAIEENKMEDVATNKEEHEAKTTGDAEEENREAEAEYKGLLATIEEGEVEEPDSDESEDEQEIEQNTKEGPEVEDNEEDDRKKAAEEKQRIKELLELKRQVLRTAEDTDGIVRKKCCPCHL